MEVPIPEDFNILQACQLAVKEAQKANRSVFFYFKEVKVFTHPDSRPEDLAEIFRLKQFLKKL